MTKFFLKQMIPVHIFKKDKVTDPTCKTFKETVNKVDFFH